MSSDREEDTLPVTDAAAEAEEPSSDSEADQEPQPSTSTPSTQVANGGGGGGGSVVLSKTSLRRIAHLKRIKKFERAKQLEKQLTKKAIQARIKEQRTLANQERRKPFGGRPARNNADFSNTDMTVVFDLSFENMMNDKEIEKCAHELRLIYEMNRRSKKPIPLYWTGIPAGGAMEKHMARHDANRNWDVKYSSESFVDLFDPNRLVYLTRDSDEVLTKLEKGTVYVIGGLLDHRRNPGHCLELATAMNIRHARLPLQEHVRIKNYYTLLSITQVFTILIHIHLGKPWKETLLKVTHSQPKPM